jgi:nucleoside-diphosphate-sugar epimerase
MATVVITGAAGNIGTKLRAHFSSLGWTLRLLDAEPMPIAQFRRQTCQNGMEPG